MMALLRRLIMRWMKAVQGLFVSPSSQGCDPAQLSGRSVWEEQPEAYKERGQRYSTRLLRLKRAARFQEHHISGVAVENCATITGRGSCAHEPAAGDVWGQGIWFVR